MYLIVAFANIVSKASKYVDSLNEQIIQLIVANFDKLQSPLNIYRVAVCF